MRNNREEQECISIEAEEAEVKAEEAGWRRSLIFSKHERERSWCFGKRRGRRPVRKSRTEDCCAIEVWISKETGGNWRRGRSRKPV